MHATQHTSLTKHCRFHLQDFDAAPFGLSESEAIMVDPQQRLLLEAASGMLAAAAVPLQQLQQQRAVGVFIGISNPDYADLKKNATPIGVYSATGGHPAVIRTCILAKLNKV
jgi:acyl transferase domain-containing protein